MPGIIDADPDGLIFTEDDWKERVSGFQPGGGDIFGLEQSECCLVGTVPWAKRFSFVNYVLGYSFVEGYELRRRLPLFHPWYEVLSAYSVALQPYRPDGSELKREAVYPGYTWPFAAYEEVEATIKFRQEPYRFAEDWDVDYEYERYCYDVAREGNLELLSQTGRILKFAEGPERNPRGVEFPSEVGIPKYQETIEFKWMWVPAEFVISSVNGGLIMPKIAACVGKLNDAAFLGYPAGTLLLNPVKIERFLWPLRTDGDSQYGYHITFPFTYFNPISGVDPQLYYGHNLMPWRGNGKWYLATDTGSTAGFVPTSGTETMAFLPYAHFPDMFTHADA